MARTTWSSIRPAAAPPSKRRINDDPMAGLTPVERAMAQRLTSRHA